MNMSWDILRNPSKEKGKKIASPLVTSSSSSSSDDNEAPSFLEFYDELSDNEDLTKAQREKRGMFKCLNHYIGTITNLLSEEQPYERTLSLLLERNPLLTPQALIKSILVRKFKMLRNMSTTVLTHSTPLGLHNPPYFPIAHGRNLPYLGFLWK
ncbi:hypothetical protein Tco_0044776 [Tanacetum coccineum]